MNTPTPTVPSSGLVYQVDCACSVQRRWLLFHACIDFVGDVFASQMCCYDRLTGRCVQDEHWAARHVRFPEDTPMNKEYYLLRSLFEERFPGAAALNTVPKGLSIACSTPEAVAWDPTWANIHDISGRAVSIHEASEGYETATDDDSSGMPQDDLGGTSAPVGNNGNGNGVTKAAQRTVTPSALRQPLQLRMRTMHVPQPRVRARGSAMLSANKAGRIGLRLM